jgi:hypothetical protein
MRNFAHVAIQIWRGWAPYDLYGGWFSALGCFKTLIGTIGLVLGACSILPLVLWSIRTIMEATIERKTATHVMMLWRYKRLNQVDAL